MAATPKIPIRTVVIPRPPMRYMLSNVKRACASIGEKPTDAKRRPIHALVRPFSMLPLEIARTIVIATKQSPKYSHGPIANAISATV